jgi:hypothetical protein
MSTWRPPWSAPGQFKLTLLPATRASNSVTARPAPGPGSTAALRARSQDPGTPRPARRSRLARWPTTSAPVGPSPSGHAQPAQPQPPPQHHTSGGPGQASTDPRRPHRADRRVWRGREAFALLGWENNASMAVPMRNGRRRAAGAGPMVRAFGDTRTCAQDGCTAQLSRYNPTRRCAIHQGWDRQVVTRPRIRQQGHGRG